VHKLFVKYLELGILLGAGFFFVPRETRDEIKSQDVKDSRSTQEEKRGKKKQEEERGGDQTVFIT
jgi:hypothetical protein